MCFFVCPAEPVTGAKVVVRSGAVEFFEGKKLELNCTLTAGNHVSYEWRLNGRLVSQSPSRYAADNRLLINRLVEYHGEDQHLLNCVLTIELQQVFYVSFRTTSADSGSYMCIATNHYNTTTVFTSNSSEVEITLKGSSSFQVTVAVTGFLSTLTSTHTSVSLRRGVKP